MLVINRKVLARNYCSLIKLYCNIILSSAFWALKMHYLRSFLHFYLFAISTSETMHTKARMEKTSKTIKRTELDRIKDKNRVCSWYGSMRWMGLISQLNLCCTFGCAKFFLHWAAIDLHRIFRWNGGKLVNCMICGSRRVWYLSTIALISIEISCFNYLLYVVLYYLWLGVV